MGTKLRVCPFCGGKAELIDEASDRYFGYSELDEWVSLPTRVQCRRCGANIQAGEYDDKEDIIERWNVRPIVDKTYGVDYDEQVCSEAEIILRLFKLIDEYNQFPQTNSHNPQEENNE